jgi:hypothetical protein
MPLFTHHRSRGLLCVLGALLPLAARAADEPTADSLLRRGQAHAEKREYDRAITA